MLLKVTGIMEFEPEDKTRKHKSQASWKRVAIIRTNDDTADYYSWFINRRFNLPLNKPLRGAHVSIVNDAERDFSYGVNPRWETVKAKYDGKPMDFYIDLEPRTNGEHWWFRVYCPAGEDMREELGLKRDPFYSLHMTIGYANEKNMAHSYYILDVCQRHGIISSEPRKPMDEHAIVNNF
jgi:hypothetical protein